MQDDDMCESPQRVTLERNFALRKNSSAQPNCSSPLQNSEIVLNDLPPSVFRFEGFSESVAGSFSLDSMILLLQLQINKTLLICTHDHFSYS